MKYPQERRREIATRFLDWCDKLGYSGDDGVTVIIVDGLPVGIQRAVQSVRFDLTEPKQNTTIK